MAMTGRMRTVHTKAGGLEGLNYVGDEGRGCVAQTHLDINRMSDF